MTKTYGNFSDFITFTRASAATIRDAADGDKIKWPGHNLFASSDDLTSGWAYIVVGASTDTITVSTTGSYRYIYEVITVTSGQKVTLAGIFEYVDNPWIWLLGEQTGGGDGFAFFNIQTGELGTASPGLTASIEPDPNGGSGYLCKIEFTGDGGAEEIGFGLSDANSNYNGTAGKSVKATRLRLYRSDLPMVANPDYPDDPTYYPTTGTAIGLENRPRGNQPTGTAGKRGLLVEPARTNLFTYSNDLSNAVWLNFNTTVTGTTTATLTPISAGPNVYPFYRLAVTVTNPSVITQTIEAKSNGYDFIALSLHNGATTAGNEVIQVFDIANGTVESTYNTAPTTSTIEELSDGWYRLSITWTVASTFAVPGFWPLDSDRAPRTSWTADGTSGVMIRYLQMEVGSYPTSYIPTAGATATRAEENPNITPESFGYNTKTGTWIAEVYDTNFTTGNSRILGAEGAECVFAHNNIDADVVNFNGTDALVKNSALTGGSGKLALSYEPGSRRMIINATSPVGAVGDYLDTNPPTIFSIGTGVGLPMGGVITSLKYYPRALSDTQLQELTS